MSLSQHILYTKPGYLATLTFNRPEALNAINGSLMRELNETLRAAPRLARLPNKPHPVYTDQGVA